MREGTRLKEDILCDNTMALKGNERVVRTLAVPALSSSFFFHIFFRGLFSHPFIHFLPTQELHWTKYILSFECCFFLLSDVLCNSLFLLSSSSFDVMRRRGRTCRCLRRLLPVLTYSRPVSLSHPCLLLMPHELRTYIRQTYSNAKNREKFPR